MGVDRIPDVRRGEMRVASFFPARDAEVGGCSSLSLHDASRAQEGIASHSQLIAHILKPQHTPPKEGEAEAVEPAMLFSPTKLRQNRLRRTRKKGSPSRLKRVVKEKVMANNE